MTTRMDAQGVGKKDSSAGYTTDGAMGAALPKRSLQSMSRDGTVSE